MRSVPLLCLLLALPLSAGSAPRAGAGTRLQPIDPPAAETEKHVYIVQFRAPAAVQDPARQGRFNPDAADVRQYVDRLTARHDAALDSVGAGPDKLYSYRYALNGVAARLTPGQAQKLKSRRDVRNVWEDHPKYVETNSSPSFLGLLAKDGGLRSDLGLRGENIVIGVIDSGIAPGHPSVSDKQEAPRPNICKSVWAERSLLGRWLCKRFENRPSTLVYSPLPGWQGACETGERFPATVCNNKLIGARFYIDGFLERYTLDDNEFISPRDADGHGTHIASTAAGNLVQATLAGTRVAKISGMAPRARIAVYKACWLEPGQDRGTCSTADLARAIEDAVADGVDIINYSVGSYDDINDADDLALLAAADAGVLSVAAAGNDGPLPGSINSPAAAPWVLAVGASSRRGTHFLEALRVNSPASVQKDYPAIEALYTPQLRNAGPLTLRLVLVDDGTNGSFDDGTGTTFDACEALLTKPSVTGQIALVQQGGCTFETKILNAQNAGAKAVVVISNKGEPLLMKVTEGSVQIPALMIGQADGQLLRDRLVAKDTVEVTLDKQLILTVKDEGNQLQAFSSRGPSMWEPNVLKPDVTAPGLDILAGYTPDVANNVRGEYFQYLSGTSMAAPHVAGIAALLKEKHPDWSPAALKSALVTSARQNIRKEDGNQADPFDFGGGHVVPNLAVNPGLVYDAGSDDYDAFLCGRGQARLGVDCAALETAGFPTNGSDLNQPSIAISELVGNQVIRRRVTNVGPAAQFSASVEAPTTIDVTVTPPLLSLNTGETADVEVRVATDGTTLNAWQFGALTWSSADAVVRSPLAIRALPFAAPAVVAGIGAAGSADVALRVGYSGSYVPELSGLETTGQSQPDEFRSQLINSVDDDPNDAYEFVQPTAGTPPRGVRRIPIVVPERTRYLRVALFNEHTTPGADLDLYLYSCPNFGKCGQEAVDQSMKISSSDEIIELWPAEGEAYITAGAYYVDVHGYNTPPGGATFQLFVWTIGTNQGNATVTAPSSVSPGITSALTLNWQNLASGLNLGLVTHTDGTTTLGKTVIEVTAP